jgi:hypothetical protein
LGRLLGKDAKTAIVGVTLLGFQLHRLGAHRIFRRLIRLENYLLHSCIISSASRFTVALLFTS